MTQQSSRSTSERWSPETSEYLGKQETGGEEHLEASWEDKPLPGTYDRQNEEVTNIRKSYQRMEKAALKENTNTPVMVGQVHPLSTRATEGSTTQDPRARRDF